MLNYQTLSSDSSRPVIGVFDSGYGGITTWRALKTNLPDVKCLYFGDHQNCPYDNKSQDELIKITTSVVTNLAHQGAKIIVIACNTATTQCIHELRRRFPELIFVGTEPALNVARDAGCQNILLLATPSTVQSRQVKRLVDHSIGAEEVTLMACPDLARRVEASFFSTSYQLDRSRLPAITAYLDTLFAKIEDPAVFDGVVLGCTHYIHIQSQIEPYFPQARFFNGNAGVVRRVKAILEDLTSSKLTQNSHRVV